jgi:hypothetical protein
MRTPLLMIGGAMVVAAVVLGLNVGAAALTCFSDTSYCAMEGKREWRGVVLTGERRPVARARVHYEFESTTGSWST